MSVPVLSYVHGCGASPLLGHTVGESLNRAAAQFGDRDALVSCHQDVRYSYAELLDHVNCAARALMHLGVERGDRVGIWSPNAAEWMISQFAASKVGAILVNINTAYRLRELEFTLNQAGVKVLIAASRFRKADYVEMLETLMPELGARSSGPLDAARIPALREVIYLGTKRMPGGLTWTEFIALADQVSPSMLSSRESLLQCDDPINIQYTSGTTGFPKGATLSHHNILNNAYFVGRALRYTEEDRVCVCVPFYHCFGMVLGNLASTSHGACIVVPGWPPWRCGKPCKV